MSENEELTPNTEALAAWVSIHSKEWPAYTLSVTSPASRKIRMLPFELLAIRENLGLTREGLADALDVSVASVRSWENGHRPVPDRVRRYVEFIEAYTNELAASIATQLIQDPHSDPPTIGVYANDELLVPDLPEAPLSPTARWWRVVAYRAVGAVPGARLVDGTKRYLFHTRKA